MHVGAKVRAAMMENRLGAGSEHIGRDRHAPAPS
jgi:hypothetical protein